MESETLRIIIFCFIDGLSFFTFRADPFFEILEPLVLPIGHLIPGDRQDNDLTGFHFGNVADMVDFHQ